MLKFKTLPQYLGNVLNFKDINLLYVEDEPGVIEVMKDVLQLTVNELYVAKDGEEALELYAKHNPNVMLVDINIPKINGLDLISKIRLIRFLMNMFRYFI